MSLKATTGAGDIEIGTATGDVQLTTGAGDVELETPQDRLVNLQITTGAGDIYAGGCLYGWVSGMSPEQAAGLGNHAAAELVKRFGARYRHLDHYSETLEAFQNGS